MIDTVLFHILKDHFIDDTFIEMFSMICCCILCHFILSSYQNSTRSRTSATSDFSNVTVSLPASTVSLPSS